MQFKKVSILHNMLELSTTGNVFQFEGEYYRQKSGMAMGSSFSPIMSNIFVEYFETELLPDVTQRKWLRYVMIFLSRGLIMKILTIFSIFLIIFI